MIFLTTEFSLSCCWEINSISRYNNKDSYGRLPTCCEVWGSHSGGYEDPSLVEYDAVSLYSQMT